MDVRPVSTNLMIRRWKSLRQTMIAMKSVLGITATPDEFIAFHDPGDSNVLHPEGITHDMYETLRMGRDKSKIYDQDWRRVFDPNFSVVTAAVHYIAGQDVILNIGKRSAQGFRLGGNCRRVFVPSGTFLITDSSFHKKLCYRSRASLRVSGVETPPHLDVGKG